MSYESRLQRAIVGVCYGSFSEYLDVVAAPILDSCLEVERMEFDFTQEDKVFGNFDGFIVEEEGVEGDSSIEEAMV